MKKILLVLLFVIGFIFALVIKYVFFTGLKLEHSKYIYNATFMYNKSEENYLPVSVQTVKVAKKSVDDLLGTNNCFWSILFPFLIIQTFYESSFLDEE